MKTVIIDYGAGNVRSVQFALERLGVSALVTTAPEDISSADKVIFPGVGEAAFAKKALVEKGLDEVISRLEQPVLGICLGMQLMCKSSEEGEVKGLGIFDLDIHRFRGALKVPHMGWNEVKLGDTPLSKGLALKSAFYFVHSYYAPLCKDTCGVTEYGEAFSAMLCRSNFYGCQFHPERSGKAGEQVLSNFLSL